MKLAAKLVSIIILGIIIILAVDGYISLQRQTKLLEKDVELESHLIGLSLKDLVPDVWHRDGQEEALKVIEDANRGEHRVHIRWVWLDVPSEDIFGTKVSLKKLGLAIQGQEVSIKEANKEGEKYFYVYFPIAVDAKRKGALEFSESLSQVEEYTRAAFIRIFVLTVVLVLLSIFSVLLLGVRMIGRPLSQIIDKIRRVGIGDFSSPLHLQSHDELREIAAGLNSMCEQIREAMENLRLETKARIETLEQLRHEDRLTTVGRLASGITYNPPQKLGAKLR